MQLAFAENNKIIDENVERINQQLNNNKMPEPNIWTSSLVEEYNQVEKFKVNKRV